MSAILFCLIFIQVCVFLIAGITLGISFFGNFQETQFEPAPLEAAMPVRTLYARNIYQEARLTQSELEYFRSLDRAFS